ncbi:MAG: hypothetical protein JWQ59_2049 [Cryobacterium sp.]|nr:hypothetical protein [Cryobacterium sp.]
MSRKLEQLFSRTPGQRRWGLGAALAGIILVPLAVAGLFAGALGTADERIDSIPAIVVNNDTMVTTTMPDGTEQQVLAGRQLVTELTGSEAAGFDWTISNSVEAKAALESGTAYAVLTVPRDFSASITSMSGTEPRQADLRIRTDDAHSYLAGSAAQSVGTALTGAFGREISSRYLEKIFTSLAGMGTSLSTAAEGADQLASGVTGIAAGLDTLAAGASTTSTGAASAATGATSFSGGLDRYTRGVDSLSSGLGTLNSGAAGLSQLSGAWSTYSGGVSSAAGGFGNLAAGILSDPLNAGYAAPLAEFQAALDQLATQSAQLSSQTTTAISGVQEGVARSAAGAAQVAGGSAALRSGAVNVASGVSALSGGVEQLAVGATGAAAGAHQLESGAEELATGLTTGAAAANGLAGLDPETAATVVSEPVTVSASRAHELDSIGPVLGSLFVPVGLWIGALTIFLILRPLSPLALASTASTGRLVFRALGRGFAIAAVQAALIAALLHGALGVPWDLLPATLPFAVLLAVVFTAVHHFLTVAFGRVGIVVSLVLLALQLTATGGIYPLEIVAEPFQAVSQYLPLTWAVDGMQAIVSGGGGAEVAASAAILALFALVSIALSTWIVARRRRVRSFSFAFAG